MNIAGFDSQFILNWMQRHAMEAEKIIIRGLQLITMRAQSITILDSLNYLNMPLAAFAKAFDLPSTKGYFPHLFNTAENWNYEGEIPDAWYVICHLILYIF